MRHVSISLYLLCSLLLIANSTFSQHQHLPSKPAPARGFCAQSEVMERAFGKDTKLRQHHEEIERRAYLAFSKPSKKEKQLPPTYTLPVVVHIVHNGGVENLSDATVLQGIQDLNDAYANVGYYDPSTGVDAKIQFCLAKRDPNGNATTGITRNQSSLTDMDLDFQDIQLKDLNRWDPEHYINIWLVKEICSTSYGCGVAGYAYFPSSHGNPEDGLVMEAEYFGSSQGASGVQVHEMGHYLGLYHTFQGGCTNNDCLANGDRVCDTPPDQSTAAVPCGTSVNSCSTDANSGFSTDQDDLIEDYMDYGDFNCWSVFTQGQADRMIWHIENVRASLLESEGCTDPCTSALSAGFSNSANTVSIGGTVNFASTSTNASSYSWTVGGVAFASTQNASYAFNALGQFEVCLMVGNADPNCSDKACKTINVTCPVVASLTTSNLYPPPGQQVIFANTSTGATTYAWTVDGVPAGNSANLTYTFANPGNSRVCLTASNGLCSNEFCQQVFVFESVGGGECTGTYLKSVGLNGIAEGAFSIVQAPDDDLLIGGFHGNASMIAKIKPSGEIVWTRTFDLTSGDDFVFKMMLDSDNNLLVTGRDVLNSNTLSYVFKYDWQNDQILWTKLIPLPSYTRLEILLEKSPGGNYLVLGMANLNDLFLEFDRNNGALLNTSSFNVGDTDHFLGAAIHNNQVYAVGAQRTGGLGTIRGSMTKLDINTGGELVTRFYFNSLNETARTYLYEIIIENNGVMAYGRGDLSGDSFDGGELLLLKTDLDGNYDWAKRYNIPGSNTEFSGSMVSLPDGFILQGNHILNNTGASENLLMRVDKLGNIVWAKSIKKLSNNWGDYVVYHDGYLYLTGATKVLDNAGDLFLGKISLDGEVVGGDCADVYDINVVAANVTNQYDGIHPLGPINDSIIVSTGNNTSISQNLQGNYLTGCQCTEFEPACDTSFLRTYGTPLGDERSQALVEIPAALGGGFLLGGSKLDSAMLTRLDVSGNIVWTRSFDATSQGPTDVPDIIVDLMFDSDNNVVGCGHTYDEPDGNVEGFIFKYNIATNNILWVNELDLNDPALEFYTSVSEKSPGGNYIVTGTINTALGTSTTGENGTILEINRATGVNVWQFNYNLGSSENFQKTIVHNGAIYTTGRYNFDNGGTARMRPGITKMNLTGVQQWSKLYLRGVTSSTSARLYSTDIVADNGLVVLGQGDNSGTSTSNVTPFLFKTDNDGNLLWAMNYDIPGANTEVTTKLINLADGYLCLGYYSASSQDVFLFKTDKQGQLLWSKSYGNAAAEDAFDMVVANGQIYFTGKTKAAAAASTFDLYFANIRLDGTSNALDSCNLFSDLNMTSTPYVNAYNAQHNLTDLNQNWNNFLDDYTVSETAVQSTTVCFQPCLDTCEVVPNALYQTASATCLGDSLLVSLTACNLGNFDLPTGTPISFYLGNPTTTNATLIGTYTLPQALAKDECGTFQYTISAPPNTLIYVMLNDDGTTPRPFTLADFMADAMECDYANNLGGFMHDFTAPVLNLGPDITACENGVAVLDAGPGFASYRWQDGSTEQTLTTFAPGTYSVTVTDACGGTQSDEVQINTDPATVLDLGPDLQICEGSSQTLNASGFTSYQWSPADYLSCTNCPNPTITPAANISYTVVATNANGCISVDTIAVTLLPSLESVADVVLCEGDTVMVFGMPVTASGQFSQTYTSSTGCDSTVTVNVGMIEIVESVSDVVLCEGDTVMVFGMPVTASGQFSQTYTASTGCDSIVTISVGMIEIVEAVADVVLCEGDTVMVFGMPVTATGQFSQTYTASTGCDSIITISVGMIPKVYTQESLRICQGETADVFGVPTGTAGTYSMTFTSSATGCDSIHTIVLTVDAINMGIAATNVSCNTLGSATVNVNAGNGPFTYHWSNSGNSATITNLAAGSYTVIVTDVNGCTNTATASITGALGPGASIMVLAQLTEDEPDGGKLSASAIGGTAPFSFAWSNGETTATIDNLSSGAYTVTVTDANGCTATATAYLYVPACTGGKIWNDLDRDGCQDAPTPGSSETGIGQVVLTLSGTTIWGQTVADTTVSAINGEYIFEGLAPGNYIVKIKLPPNMTLSPAMACNDGTHDSDFNTTTMLSNVVNLVEGHCCLTVDGGLFDACLNLATSGQICCDQTLCGPGNDPAPITSLLPAGGGGGATQYLWMYSTVGGPMGSNWTTIAGANGPSYDPGPLSQTTHFVRCAKSATCTTWLESNFVTITVSDVAVADILPPGSICVNDPVTFTAAANGTGASYSWNFGPWANPGTSNQPSVSVVFNQTGVTTVDLTVIRNGCTSTDALDIFVSSIPSYCAMGIVQPENEGQAATSHTMQMTGSFTAYPNPFSDGLTVAWDAGLESVVSIELYSVEGKLLHSGKSEDGDARYIAELGSLLPGVYLLHLHAESGEAAVFKVVKEKR